MIITTHNPERTLTPPNSPCNRVICFSYNLVICFLLKILLVVSPYNFVVCLGETKGTQQVSRPENTHEEERGAGYLTGTGRWGYCCCDSPPHCCHSVVATERHFELLST